MESEAPDMVSGAQSRGPSNIRAERGAAIAIVNGESVRGWFMTAALVLSVTVIVYQGVLLHDYYKHQQTQAWLAGHDLNYFEANGFARLKEQVIVNHDLLIAFENTRCVNAQHKPVGVHHGIR